MGPPIPGVNFINEFQSKVTTMLGNCTLRLVKTSQVTCSIRVLYFRVCDIDSQPMLIFFRLFDSTLTNIYLGLPIIDLPILYLPILDLPILDLPILDLPIPTYKYQ